MKKCKECGCEVADDAIHCPNCGGYEGGHCSVCGTKLVNDYEREQGICVNCETPSSVGGPYPSKYIKRLRVFEILCYVCAVITLLAAFGVPGMVVFGLIALVPWIGMGVIFGALREILGRIK